MAGIDKIYCSISEGRELIKFLQKHQRNIYKKTNCKYPLNHCYGICGSEGLEIVFNFGEHIDSYLSKYCKLEFVQVRLSEQYNDPSRLKIKKQKKDWWMNKKCYSNLDVKKWLGKI